MDLPDVARIEVENDRLRFECELLRTEATRLGAINRMLQAQLALAERERDRLQSYSAAIEHSRSWRVIQGLRGIVGRRW